MQGHFSQYQGHSKCLIIGASITILIVLITTITIIMFEIDFHLKMNSNLSISTYFVHSKCTQCQVLKFGKKRLAEGEEGMLHGLTPSQLVLLPI